VTIQAIIELFYAPMSNKSQNSLLTKISHGITKTELFM
jgi:hypothetical protein